jgi:hypothetical protein
MDEEKWWLAPTLTPDKRSMMTEEQRGERRLMVLNAKLANRRDALTDVRRRRMSRLLRDWFHGEILHEIAETRKEEEQGFRGMKRWLREQFLAAIAAAFKGHDEHSLIEEVLRREVARYMQLRGYTHNDEKFNTFARKVIEDEVRRQIIGSITISATIKGTVHTPAVGSRAIKLSQPDEPWED